MESKKINQLATELTPALDDLTIIGDPTTGISKKITLSQMASLFTGTVEEYANLAAFPLVGTADTIYIALDTNVLYRWDTGLTSYVELSPNIINSLVFSDANGFDGNISLVGSVATLTITTALTTGSVPFIGASGALSQDNANLFFDDTNNRLGINTNAPTTALDVFGSGIIGRLNGTSTNNAFLGFSSAGSNKWSIGNVQSDHRFRIYNEATTSELVSVLQTGEFGIGIANPTTKIHIDGGASALIANLDANVSVAKSISFRSDNSNRINLEVSGTESGSNAGANFFIRRYSDAGALIDTPLTITRSTGAITLATELTGTSATLSGNLTMNTNNSSAIRFTNAAGSGTAWDMFADSLNNAYFRNSGSAGFVFTNGTTNFLSIASTGSATFISDLFASGRFGATSNQITPTDGNAYFYKSSSGAVVSGFQFIAETGSAGSRAARLTIDSAGTATFSSSVTANSAIFANGSVSSLIMGSPQLRLINNATATANQRVDLGLRWEDGTYNGIGGISMVRESATARLGRLVLSGINSAGDPNQAVNITGGGIVQIGILTSSTYGRLVMNAGSNQNIWVRSSGGIACFEATNDAVTTNVAMRFAATEYSFASGGNVLIGGTTDFGQRLQVNGSIRMPVGSLFNYGSGAMRSTDTVTVTTSTTNIFTSQQVGSVDSGNLVLVTGVLSGTGANFVDLVLFITNGSAILIQQRSIASPAGRTYTVSGTTLQLTMSSGTYVVASTAFIQGYNLSF